MQAHTYASKGLHSVHGWLTPSAANCIVKVANLQTQSGISGGACEIGVHHGRLFILLHLLLRAGENSLAVDLFEMQQENIDSSGRGSRDAFLTNLRRFDIDPQDVNLLAENSLRLTAEKVKALIGPVRLFSIDGGHTAEITYNDLAIADGSTCGGGLIILDDFFNPAWPGVTEGAFRYVHERGGLSPVAFVSNKMIFAKGDATHYRAILHGEIIDLFGAPCVVHRRTTRTLRERLVASPFWGIMRQTWAGNLVRRLVR